MAIIFFSWGKESMLVKKYQVLMVDDEPALLDIAKSFLEVSERFEVTTVTSVKQALLVLTDLRFDAIVSDYQMPGEDGIQFLKELKSRGDSTPFILFTGRGREDVAIEALNNGADFYIRKGFDLE
jgi:DNA-binding response OmpR family regulator